MSTVISLVPTNLGSEPVAAESPTMQKIKIQAISLRDALVVGVVTGFALAAGNLIFTRVARRFRWR